MRNRSLKFLLLQEYTQPIGDPHCYGQVQDMLDFLSICALKGFFRYLFKAWCMLNDNSLQCMVIYNKFFYRFDRLFHDYLDRNLYIIFYTFYWILTERMQIYRHSHVYFLLCRRKWCGNLFPLFIMKIFLFPPLSLCGK